MKYLAFDADDIGNKIEKLILEEKLDALTTLSDHIARCVEHIASHFNRSSGDTIFANGDGGLIQLNEPLLLEETIELFSCSEPEFTFSVGLGATPRDAWLALKYAKTNKPGWIRYSQGEFESL